MMTRRLSLRSLTLDDAGRIASIAGDWDVVRMTARMPFPYCQADAESWIGGLGADEVVRGLEHEGQIIGACGYTDNGDASAELGYWIGRAYWGHGFATEAARAMANHAFTKGGYRRLTCCHFADNPASARVIGKLGFRLVGACSGWSEARRADAPTLRYAMDRPWSAFIARIAA